MKYGNYRGKRRFEFMRSPVTLVAIFIVLVILAKATWSIHQKADISTTRLAQAQKEYEKLQARQKDLQSEVNYLSTDQGIEAELRTKYRAVKEGESVAVIVDDSQTAAVAQSTTTESRSWWESVLQLFGI